MNAPKAAARGKFLNYLTLVIVCLLLVRVIFLLVAWSVHDEMTLLRAEIAELLEERKALYMQLDLLRSQLDQPKINRPN